MENTTKTSLITFLSEFNYPKKQKSNQFNLFDKEFHKKDDFIIALADFEKYSSSNKLMSTDKIQSQALALSTLLNKEEKVKLFLFLVFCYQEATSHFITPEYQPYLFCAGEALGISNQEIVEIIAFQLADQPYTDRVNALYLVPKQDKMCHEMICVNTLSYEKEHVTYFKYLKSSNVCISKKFKKVTLTNFMDQNLNIEGLMVINKNNYNRKDFAYHTYDETIELIENFNPLAYYELESNRNNPKIVLDPTLGKIIISGKSSPVSPTQFFEPIIEWIQFYKKQNRKDLNLYIMLDYMNTYTSRFLVSLAKEVKELSITGGECKIYWYFDSEDEDLIEMGQTLQNIFPGGIIYCPTDEVLAA